MSKPRKTPRPGSAAYNKRMRELGLVPPMTAKVAATFKATQKKLYTKLKKGGFNDLEWTDHNTGRGQNTDYLKQSASMARLWRPEKAQFFRLLRNYATHGQFKTKRDKAAVELLAEGISFRRILKHLKSYYKYSKSLYTLFYELQDLLKDCHVFNVSHPEGLLNLANADSWADDALLSDLSGRGEAYLGLPLDAGWFDDNFSRTDEQN